MIAASVRDSQVFEALLDQSQSDSSQKRTIYSGSAYCSVEKAVALHEIKIEGQSCERGKKTHPPSEARKAFDHGKSKVRSRVGRI